MTIEPSARLRLGVNIDHVATVRNARGGALPDPVRAAKLAVAAGADGITAHLREDRRHIRDADIANIKAEIAAPLNFEMAATQEMVAIALRTLPNAVCLVPEKREERTTEGGLDVISAYDHLALMIARLTGAGIRVSLFIEPDDAPIKAAKQLGAHIVELHTGTWCEMAAHGEIIREQHEYKRLAAGAKFAHGLGLEVHAGHGLNYDTARRLAAVSEFEEFNIGHFLIGESIFVGLEAAVHTMRKAMDSGRSGQNGN
jgi:pyridoxine 5-phosphate synthase